MNADFHPSSLSLNKKAQDVLGRIDESLALYQSRDKKPTELHLFKAHWKTLDKALKTASNGKLTLETHTYRGARLLCKER